MPRPHARPPAYAPPVAPDAVMYFRGDMRKLESFGMCFGGIERFMGYRQPNILWGTLAMSRPTPTANDGVIYRVDLPKPVFLSDSMFLYTTDGSMLREGHHTGRISLHLSDARFYPSFSAMDQVPSIRRRDMPQALDEIPDCSITRDIKDLLSKQIQGHCEITLCLESLRRIELPDSSSASLPERLWANLVDMRRSAVDALTSLLHPDASPDLTSPLF
jgi:hypothetical protein